MENKIAKSTPLLYFYYFIFNNSFSGYIYYKKYYQIELYNLINHIMYTNFNNISLLFAHEKTIRKVIKKIYYY